MYQFGFEKLEVWQEARKLVKEVYLVTQKFPSEEKYGMISQIRRPATSVCANIAEGSTRRSYKEQMNFSTIAYGSLIELLNHLILAADLQFITSNDLETLRNMLQPLSVRINNLRNAQLNKLNSA
jgi:four helix bundle protein